MMGYRTVGDVISKAKIEKCGNNEYPVLSMTMHDGIMFQGDRFKKQIASVDQSTYNVVRRNQLVVSFPIDEGVLAVQDITDVGIVSPAYKIWSVNASMMVPKYLELFLRSPRSIQFYKAKLRGSTARRRSITDDDLLSMEIPVLSLEKQQEVIDIISYARQIIELYKKELSTLDDLIKARFVEMFGDPFGNPKEWRRLTFKDAGERLSDGPFGSNLKSEHYTDSGVRVIRLGNIGVGRFIDNDQSYISSEHYEKLKKYSCKAGEIVIGTLGEPNLRACMIPEKVGIAINKADCVHYIPKSEILNNDFVCQYINCPETLLLAKRMIHGQTRSRVSSGQIAQMLIFVPPIECQNEFSEFKRQADKSKAVVQKALDQAQLLFDSLMQKYFG